MRSALPLLALSGLLGCSLSQRGLEPASDSYAVDAGNPGPRGSEACQAWQRASCDYASDRCGLLPRALCEAQNEGVECLDDAEAERCAEAFEGAPCQRPPEGCALRDVADARWAVVTCEDYFDAQCQSNLRCGLFDSVEECLDHPQLAFDCNRALSIGLELEACLLALAERRCDQSVPICDNIVRAR